MAKLTQQAKQGVKMRKRRRKLRGKIPPEQVPFICNMMVGEKAMVTPESNQNQTGSTESDRLSKHTHTQHYIAMQTTTHCIIP